MKIEKVVSLEKKAGAYIRTLQNNGVIKKYVIDKYVAYDVDEYEEYRKVAKRGRPIKE